MKHTVRAFIALFACSGIIAVAVLLPACTRQQKNDATPGDTLRSGRKIGNYTIIDVHEGRTLKGVISVVGDMNGAVASMGKRFVTNGQPECMDSSTEKPQQKLLLKDGRLKNVVISLVNCDSGKSPAGYPTLDQVHCDFVPHVLALMAGDSVAIVNSDPIVHATHGYVGIHTMFNIATPTKGVKYYIHFPKENVVRCICDAGHPWMEAYIHVLPNPYYAITGDDGSFVIDDIPPGTYTVNFSHELWNDTTTTITIPPHGNIDASQTFDLKNMKEL